MRDSPRDETYKKQASSQWETAPEMRCTKNKQAHSERQPQRRDVQKTSKLTVRDSPRDEMYKKQASSQWETAPETRCTKLETFKKNQLTGHAWFLSFIWLDKCIIIPLKPELNPICYLLALLGAHHFLHVSRIRVKLLTFRLLMSYIYGAPHSWCF